MTSALPQIVRRIRDQKDLTGPLTPLAYIRLNAAGTLFELSAVSVPVTSVFGRTGNIVSADGDYTVSQITGAAPLASPTFTGIPVAPTAAPGTNTSQLATTAFIRAEVAALVASAPGTLDTLNELALALGSDPNFAATVTNSLALKAPLASPTFTGTPAAPTASVGTNTTQLATTAYVLNNFANPSGLIGMTAANGVATTFVRSDARHAIDPAIVPEWSGRHTFLASVVIGAGSVGTNGVNVVVLGNGTIPSTQPADEVQLVAADYAVGDSRVLVLSESGRGIWLGAQTVEARAPTSGAGNSLTLKASDAVSGNTGGGTLTLTPGLKSGSGVDGNVRVTRGQTVLPAGNVTLPALCLVDTDRGFTQQRAACIDYVGDGAAYMRFQGGRFGLSGSSQISWLSAGGGFTSSAAVWDASIGRVAPGVVGLSDGNGFAGGLSAITRTPAQITADQNNYSPGVGLYQRWSSDASRNITGMVAGQDGEFRHIWNVGSQNIVIQDESSTTASTAANRFLTSTVADLTLTPKKCALAQYDATSARWRVTLFP